MLDLENANGFVVDLSTDELVLEELQAVLHDKEDRQSLVEELTTPQLREFILEYYLTTYWDATIILKNINVYQIVE